MARILSHPFRLLANGAVATVEQDTVTADNEQVAVLALTHRGERPLVPGFGVTDPTFAGFVPAELVAGVRVYGPPVAIEDVRVSAYSQHEQLVEVTYA